MSSSLPEWGLVARFATSEELLRAVHALRQRGFRKLDAFTPYPIEEVSEALGHHHSRLPALVLFGAITGACFGFGLQYWTSVIDYPINVGGRPLNSIIAFIPVIFECTILFGALTAVFGMLGLNGLPKPYHPVFNAPSFALASQDAFFLSIESGDPIFQRDSIEGDLRTMGATEVEFVHD